MPADRNNHTQIVLRCSSFPVRPVAWCALAFVLSATTFVAAQAPAAPKAPVRSYIWHAELVSVDGAAQSAVFKAAFREHMLRYIDEFQPGDKLNLTWATTHEGEADDIIYLGRPEKLVGTNYGYVLTVQLVAVSKNDRTVTFKVPVPATALPALKGIRTGDRVNATSPFVQPAAAAAISSVARSEAKADSPPRVTTRR